MRLLPRIALPLVLLVASAPLALAEEVTLTGCPLPGVEAGCIMMSGNGGIYNVTAAKPTPLIGVAVKITGTVSSGVSSCGQGTILSPATTTAAVGITCTDPYRG